MSDEYTPTTDEVQSYYNIGRNEFESEWETAEFDRWLAVHDREVAARALEDAANEKRKVPADWGQALREVLGLEVQRHLWARAERIRRGDD
jgi:hypothetical protein